MAYEELRTFRWVRLNGVWQISVFDSTGAYTAQYLPASNASWIVANGAKEYGTGMPFPANPPASTPEYAKPAAEYIPPTQPAPPVDYAVEQPIAPPTIAPVNKDQVLKDDNVYVYRYPGSGTNIHGESLIANQWEPTQRSFAGCDILATAYVEGRILVCDSLSAVSYSTHREKVNVPTLGRSYARRRTRGQRTIAGTLVWIVKDRAPLWRFMGHYTYDNKAFQHLPMSDSLPPFDITLTFANEYGHVSVLRIYGIDIISEGQTHSIQDMITENVMEYQAFDMDMMMPIDAEEGELPWVLTKEGTFYRSIGNLSTPKTADTAATDAQYQKYVRAVSWLAIIQDDRTRGIYTYWVGNDRVGPEIDPYVTRIPEEVKSLFSELSIGNLDGVDQDAVTAALKYCQEQIALMRKDNGLYWNVEANRTAIINGTIPTSLPFDFSTYNFE